MQSRERLAKLVRNAEKAKIPVMCVVGEQEAKDGTWRWDLADGDQACCRWTTWWRESPPRTRAGREVLNGI